MLGAFPSHLCRNLCDNLGESPWGLPWRWATCTSFKHSPWLLSAREDLAGQVQGLHLFSGVALKGFTNPEHVKVAPWSCFFISVKILSPFGFPCSARKRPRV